MGSCLFICSIFTFWVLPEENIKEDEECQTENKVANVGAFTIFRLLLIPEIAIIAYGIMSTASGIGFLVATLEPFLRHTVIFMIHNFCYYLLRL